MVRSIATISVGIALTVAGANGAFAQAMPGPLPGTGDSTKISSGNQRANADYNHLIGAGDAKPSAKDDDRRATTSSAVPATAADLKVGSALRDIKGVHIGTVSQVEADGVVVDTGATKIKVPASAFGKDKQGLLLGLTAARFNELVAKVQTAH
ncbi:hypothetical protein ACUXST_000465 [Sphingomonas sp. F9_3S_D5_B_2]